MSRWKRVIGAALRPRTYRLQATEVAIGTDALNRLHEFGRAADRCGMAVSPLCLPHHDGHRRDGRSVVPGRRRLKKERRE